LRVTVAPASSRAAFAFLGCFLVGAFEHNTGSAVNESLCFTQAEAGECADLFDDLDLLVTSSFENDVERVLLFSSAGVAATTSSRCCGSTATGAAAVTSKTSSNFLTNSLSSIRDSSLNPQ
jgi:hypothetical protein